MQKRARKWAFVPEGAVAILHGTYTGPRVGGKFVTGQVMGGDGVRFHRTPWSNHGWKVEKNAIDCEGHKIQYNVNNPEDLAALDAFFGEPAYKGYGNYD